MTTARQQSATEQAMREFAGDDPIEQARIDLIVGEATRAAQAQAAIDRADVAALGQGRCPASLIAPFRARSRR